MSSRTIGTAVSALALVVSTSAVAQTDDKIEEVIVTAQKRAESVNKVPITISVLTSDDIVASGVGSTQQLELATPGLVFGNTNGFAQPYIRGIGGDLIGPGQESPVGFYLDGVYLPFTQSLLQEFGDIERVEVLKGPQGTLYGRNTTGGAINIVTRTPSQEFEASARISAGEQGFGKIVASMSGGLTDSLAGSLSAVGTRRDGIFKIINTDRKADDLRQWGLRGKLHYTVNDAWSATFSGDFMDKNDSSSSVFTGIVGNDLGLPPSAGPSSTPRQAYTDTEPMAHRVAHHYGANLTVRGALDAVDFTSISGYRNDYSFSTADGDNTSLPLLAFASDMGSQSWTQELQLASKGESRFDWIGGVYLLSGRAYFGPVRVWSNAPINTPPNAALLYGSLSVDAYAGYGQASYAIDDHWKVIAGLRYSHEKRDLIQQSIFGANLLDPLVRGAFGLGPVTLSKTWSSTDPKITLQYETEGSLLYGSYSTGFKSGSYNLISVTGPGPLDPEDIKAFEIGGKHDLPLARGAHIDWSVFHYKYQNLQVNVKDPGVGGIAAALNAAETTQKGVDFDFVVRLTDRFTFSIGGEYLDAEYDSFPTASVFNIVNGVLGTGFSGGDLISKDVTGNRTIRSPKFTSNAQVVWKQPLAGGELSTTASWYHNDGFFFDSGNLIEQPSFDIANLFVEYAPTDANWAVSLFGNNLFDKTVIQGINGTAFDIGAQYNEPRIVGVGLSLKF